MPAQDEFLAVVSDGVFWKIAKQGNATYRIDFRSGNARKVILSSTEKVSAPV